jgi:hypothetical protein
MFNIKSVFDNFKKFIFSKIGGKDMSEKVESKIIGDLTVDLTNEKNSVYFIGWPTICIIILFMLNISSLFFAYQSKKEALGISSLLGDIKVEAQRLVCFDREYIENHQKKMLSDSQQRIENHERMMKKLGM